MANGIKAGDVVMLKSGGPSMTVKEVKEGRAACAWFDGSKNNGAVFPVEALELVEDPRPRVV